MDNTEQSVKMKHNYCVRVNRTDGSLYSFWWCVADSPAEAIEKQKGDTKWWGCELDPPEKWIATDIDIGKQMKLL